MAPQEEKSREENTHPLGTEIRGPLGWWESALRRSTTLVHTLTLIPIYGLAALLMGICLAPGVALFIAIAHSAQEQNFELRCLVYGIALAASYFIYGFTSLLVMPLANLSVRFTIKAARGPYYSAKFLTWYLHNSLIYIVRYTFLDFVTPTPFNIAFLKMMGMRIGRNVEINTSYISDPALITIEDKVTIGGSATLIAHYGMRGYLILAPVIIHRGATIGLRAIIMGGAEIGEKSVILPNSVVLPKTKIPAGETWGGVPAVKIRGS